MGEGRREEMVKDEGQYGHFLYQDEKGKREHHIYHARKLYTDV